MFLTIQLSAGDITTEVRLTFVLCSFVFALSETFIYLMVYNRFMSSAVSSIDR